MRDIVIYVDADAKIMIRGDMIELATRANLTRERLETRLSIPFRSLALGDAIVWRRGTGERRIAVFADPLCPFCRKLETELEALPDVTVHTFLIPILGPESVEQARRLWCASDRGEAWHAWMTRNTKPVGSGDCNTTALDRNLAFARQHGILATPTVVFESGRRVSGAMPLAEIERRLAAGAQTTSR